MYQGTLRSILRLNEYIQMRITRSREREKIIAKRRRQRDKKRAQRDRIAPLQNKRQIAARVVETTASPTSVIRTLLENQMQSEMQSEKRRHAGEADNQKRDKEALQRRASARKIKKACEKLLVAMEGDGKLAPRCTEGPTLNTIPCPSSLFPFLTIPEIQKAIKWTKGCEEPGVGIGNILFSMTHKDLHKRDERKKAIDEGWLTGENLEHIELLTKLIKKSREFLPPEFRGCALHSWSFLTFPGRQEPATQKGAERLKKKEFHTDSEKVSKFKDASGKVLPSDQVRPFSIFPVYGDEPYTLELQQKKDHQPIELKGVKPGAYYTVGGDYRSKWKHRPLFAGPKACVRFGWK